MLTDPLVQSATFQSHWSRGLALNAAANYRASDLVLWPKREIDDQLHLWLLPGGKQTIALLRGTADSDSMQTWRLGVRAQETPSGFRVIPLPDLAIYFCTPSQADAGCARVMTPVANRARREDAGGRTKTHNDRRS